MLTLFHLRLGYLLEERRFGWHDWVAWRKQVTITLFCLQIGVAVVLTPLYVSGAIARDRVTGLFDLLFLAHLSNFEIYVGKFLPRLFVLSFVLLSGLPIQFLLHDWLGLSLGQILVNGLAALLLTLVLASLSLTVSVFFSSYGHALCASLSVITMLGLFVYQPMLNFANELIKRNPTMTNLWNIGQAHWNVLVMLIGLEVGLLYVGIFNLRRWHKYIHEQNSFRARFLELTGSLGLNSPRIVRFPLVFLPRNSLLYLRDCRRNSQTNLGGLCYFWYVCNSLLFLFGLFLAFVYGMGFNDFTIASWTLLRFVAGLTMLTTVLLLLIVVMIAAKSITSEKEQRTIDDLLLLPWARAEILREKKTYCFSWVDPLVLYFLCWGVLSFFLIGWQALVPLLALAVSVFVYFRFCTNLALLLSITCRNSLTAMVFMSFILFLLLIMPIMLLGTAISAMQLAVNPLLTWITLAEMTTNTNIGLNVEVWSMFLCGQAVLSLLAWLFGLIACRTFPGKYHLGR